MVVVLDRLVLGQVLPVLSLGVPEISLYLVDCTGGEVGFPKGSVLFDDEGIPTQKTVLIENGILKGYMQSRQDAQRMGVNPTGNGRRENYKKVSIPRMTNTYLAPGTLEPKEIIKTVKNGLYITHMGTGQVDTASGKFNMEATLAYLIKNGKIKWSQPVKGAMLVGDGMTVLKSIAMIGNDVELDKVGGVCGKGGQGVPVSSGNPTILVENMTIGGMKK